jgi:hypothetical protein
MPVPDLPSPLIKGRSLSVTARFRHAEAVAHNFCLSTAVALTKPNGSARGVASNNSNSNEVTKPMPRTINYFRHGGISIVRSVSKSAPLVALCLLSACAQSGKPPIARSLPDEPSFVRPVAVAEPKQGDALLTIAARERAGRIEANRIIAGQRGWYAGVQRDYAKER